MVKGQASTFVILEKQHIAKKIDNIYSVRRWLFHSQNRILKAAETFYETLYNKQQTTTGYDLTNVLKDCCANKLNLIQAHSLQGHLTLDEITYTLKHM